MERKGEPGGRGNHVTFLGFWFFFSIVDFKLLPKLTGGFLGGGEGGAFCGL